MLMNLFLATIGEFGYSAFMAAIVSGILLVAMDQIKKACHNFLLNNKAF